QDPDPDALQLVHLGRVGTRRREAIDAQEGEMGLAVPEAAAIRGEDERDVVDLVAFWLERPADDRDPMLLGQRGEAVRGDRARASRDGLRLVQRAVGIAGA